MQQEITPQVSVIVAVYNAAETLEQCLDSLLSQTDGRLQVVCVDDCSTDASPQILAARAKADSRLLVLRTPQNSGLSVARNTALPHLKGRWTFNLDADDWVNPAAVEQLLAAADAYPAADALMFQLRKVFPNGTEEAFTPFPRYTTWTGAEAIALSVCWKLHGLFALPTQRLRAMPYDTRTRIYSDDVTVREHLLTSQLLVQTDATYYYRQHPASLTHADGLARLDFIKANTHLRTMLEQYHVEPSVLISLEEYIWRVYEGIMRRLLSRTVQFDSQERATIHRELSAALQAMRPGRLPLSLRLNPHHLFLRPYGLLRAYTQVLLWLRRLLKKEYAPRA